MSSGGISAPGVVILPAYTFEGGCLVDGDTRASMLVLMVRIGRFDRRA